MKKQKEAVFFDADGTLWYPKVTKWREKPYWVYENSNYLSQLELTPNTDKTLKTLNRRGLKLFLLSTHPISINNAQAVLKEKVNYFELQSFFTGIYATTDDPAEKGRQILKILKELDIPKCKALMVGDSYRYDYKSACEQGIDAVLIRTDYGGSHARHVRRTVDNLEEILKFI